MFIHQQMTAKWIQTERLSTTNNSQKKRTKIATEAVVMVAEPEHCLAVFDFGFA